MLTSHEQLCICSTRACFCFFSSFLIQILSAFSRGTAACLHQQILLNCSAMLHLVLKCVYFHSRLVLYIFYCLEFTFLLMMDIAKSETFKNFSILNKALLFLMKL